MIAKLVFLDDNDILKQIHHHLKTLNQFADNPHFDSYFQTITQQLNRQQPIFAIGFNQQTPNHIKLIYTLHTEYKLTRQLCKCLHIEEVFTSKDVQLKEIQQFYKELLPQLNCYKVVGLGIQENSILRPNQKFMIIQNKPML